MLLLILPISYLVLKLGGNPASVFVVHLCVCVIAFIIRLFIIRSMIHLSLRDYCQQVILRCLLVLLISIILPLVLNVLLNLFFVIQCNMAAGGVAIASVIAQYVSAILVVSHLCRRKDSCRLYFSRLRFHKEAAKSVLMLGVPGGMQNAIFAIANLFVLLISLNNS